MNIGQQCLHRLRRNARGLLMCNTLQPPHATGWLVGSPGHQSIALSVCLIRLASSSRSASHPLYLPCRWQSNSSHSINRLALRQDRASLNWSIMKLYPGSNKQFWSLGIEKALETANLMHEARTIIRTFAEREITALSRGQINTSGWHLRDLIYTIILVHWIEVTTVLWRQYCTSRPHVRFVCLDAGDVWWWVATSLSCTTIPWNVLYRIIPRIVFSVQGWLEC